MQNLIKKLKKNIYEEGKLMPGIVSEDIKDWEESREEQEESKKQLLHSESKSNPMIYIP